MEELSGRIPPEYLPRIFIHCAPEVDSGGWSRTTDLEVMSLANYQLFYPAVLSTPPSGSGLGP